MPQFDFAEALSKKSVPEKVQSTFATPSEFHRPDEAPIFVEPSRFRTSRLGGSEWANILFAGIGIAGGLFCAFYFFNGGELFRTALAWPGEYLYPRPLSSGENISVAKALPDEAPPPGTPPPKRLSKTDPSGDPFPRASKLITIDRSLGSFPRGGAGLAAGSPPPISGSPVPLGFPGVSGGPIGALPGPGTLVSRLTLLRPGGDALTQTLRTAAASVVN